MKNDYDYPFIDLITMKKYDEVEKYLLDNSNLPSRQANLTLAYNFTKKFQNIKDNNDFYNWLLSLLNINQECSNDSSEVYLPFISLQSLGYYYHNLCIDKKNEIKIIFKEKSNSQFWRIQEGCAMGLQNIGISNVNELKDIINYLNIDPSNYELRMILACLADYQLLKNNDLVNLAFKISYEAIDRVNQFEKDELKQEDSKKLIKVLNYVLSVFTLFDDVQGFILFENCLKFNNKVLVRVVKENMKKARLKKYESQVNNILAKIK